MHYKQMEKPDRDYTHAMRAEDEYRILIQQFPDNTKLVPIAKQRLREVQEVLAERQYRIGRFYYLRESYPAAIARLKTLADTYPLYSQADDALMMLGRCYDDEATLIKNSKMLEAMKIRLVKEYQSNAADAYSRLIQRYPVSGRAEEARAHLKDLGRPIPTPTKEAIAENRAEEASRSEMGKLGTIMSTFHKAPNDLVRASKVGDPPLVDPQPASAPAIIRAAAGTALGTNGNNNVSVDKVTPDDRKSDPVPRSEGAPGADTAAVVPTPTANDSSTPAATATPPAVAPAATSTNSEQGIGDLTPNVSQATTQAAAAPSTSGTNGPGDAGADATASSGAPNTPPQAPAQVNELQTGTSTSSGTASADSASNSTSDQGSSSSKKKKKKGLKKLNPF
jgi:outer membrane protein assembly factor BamD